MKLESQLQVSTASGVAPFTVNQSTLVSNLNAQYLNGQLGGYYAAASSLASYLPLAGGTLTGTLYLTDATNGISKAGGRFTIRSESTDDVANFASYGLYLPKSGQTAGLYIESPIEARGGIRIGTNAVSGTITVGADTAATANRLVQRDGSGGVAAVSFSGLGTGLTGTATSLNIGGSATQFGGYTQDLQTVVGTGDYLLIRNQAASKISLASAASVATIVQGAASGSWGISVTGTAATATNVAWSGVSSRPSTLAGFGITDALPLSGGSMTGYIIGAVSGGWATYNSGSFTAYGSLTNPAIICFHRPGYFSTNLGLDTDGVIKIGGWSLGGPWPILHSNNFNSYALPLAGGTLTGALNGTTAAFSGAITQGGNQVLHAGNFSSYALPYTGGTLSGGITATNFIGPGTGLTGTATSLSIGGNAATATRTSSQSGYAHAGTGMVAFYNWGGTSQGTNAPDAGSYTTGISVGSHPGDQAYGFQIANNMWALGLWTRNYNSGFGSWVRLLDSSNYTSYPDATKLPLAGGTLTGGLSGTTAAFSGAITQGGNQVLHAGNYTSYTLPRGGSWYGANLPGTRWGGMTSAGGEIVFGQDLPAAGQMGILIDGCYIAAENNGFWSLASSNDWTTRRGMYFDGTYLRFDYNSATAYFSNASIGGNQVLHAGNYTSYPDATKLPLTGGTLTGTITATNFIGPINGNSYNNLSNNYKDIYVYGDVNTYYVVLINGESLYSFGRYSVTRGYNWTGPDTWYIASHKGGLTLDWEWSGDTAWGGNDKAIRIIEFNESYSSTVAGLGYPVNGGVIIWLRGGGVGGALYRIRTPIGSNSTVIIYDNLSIAGHVASTTFTAANSAVFSTRANTNSVSAEILARYPVRDSGGLYVDNNAVLHTGNYNSYALPLAGGTLTGTLNGTTAAFSGAITQGGNQVLHAGNYTSYPDTTKLPLAGGTLTGQVQISAGHGNTRFQLYENYNNDTNHAQAAFLTLWASEPGITWQNAGIGANINIGGQHYGRAGSGNAYGVYLRFDVVAGESIFYNTTGAPGVAGGQGNLRAKVAADGEIYATSSQYKVIHAGNYTSYSPPLGGTGATGVWPISITGNASGSSASAGYLTGGEGNFYGILYNNTSGNLNLYNTPGLISAEYVGTTNNPTGSQSNGHFIQISDAGGTDVKTQWYYQSGGIDISMRLMWGNGSWLPWRKLLHDGNYNSYALPLAGGTLTGSITATNHIGPGTGLTGTAASLTAGAVPWSGITSKPTTISGFGITDIVSSNSGSPVAADTTTKNGFYYVNSNISLFSATDGALFVQAYDNTWASQIFQDYRTGQIAIRGRNNGTWQAWRSVLDSTNASYACNMNQSVGTGNSPSFTGLSVINTITGAVSGSSGSCTGSSASCTGNAASASAVAASGITGQNGMWASANRPGPTKLYRKESDDGYHVSTYWTGSYWKLEGYYSNTTFHAGCMVSYADAAGSSASCSGNAASVTDGVYLSTNQSISGVKTFSSAPVATNIAKAWVYYNMNNNTIYASYNVSSVTDNGTGVCTVNFSSAMVDANYVVAGTATYGYDDQDIHAMILAVPRRSTAQQAGSCRLATEYIHAAGVYDSIAVRAVFYR